MSYRANRPYGRRKTDNAASGKESNHWQKIRRDVQEDSSGLIRRYLRLSEKVLGTEGQSEPSENSGENDSSRGQEPQQPKRKAA
ncbi:MAG: hypothetical protein DMG62_17605 [Acidobacteria bacterium]|nr:MAG: hypothetical protein DMG62_17605 [Acidobacteriota bacterium]